MAQKFLSALILTLLMNVVVGLSLAVVAAEITPQDFIQAYSVELAKTYGLLKEVAVTANSPLAEPTGPIPPSCNPHEFQTFILANYQNARQFAQEAQKYFDRCSSYLTEGNTLGLLGLIKFSTVTYNLNKNNLIKKTTLDLSDGSKIEAYLGIKDLSVRRPWIILKCGVFCDITTTLSINNFIINFFDQSPFNIIFVSNYTGSRYIQSNSSLRLGGFYEVYDLYDIAHWLKYDSPYSHTVDSIHAVGVSLGGSSAMAVRHLQNLHYTHDQEPLFNSTLAICPVVNLGPTLNDMYTNPKKSKIFTTLTWKYLKDAAPYLNQATDYLSTNFPPKAELFPSMLIDIVLRYGRSWESTRPPGRMAPLPINADDFLNKNYFSSEEESSFTIPTLAWGSHDDNVVDFNLNTQSLLNIKNPPPTLGALGVEFGDHCGFDTSYGYTATTSLLQSFIINNSPNFKSRSQMSQLPLPGKQPTFSRNETHLLQWWNAIPGSDTLLLHYETFDPDLGKNCKDTPVFKSKPQCRKHYTQLVSLSKLSGFNNSIPQNETEAQILTRQLNGLLRVSHSTTPIDGTQLRPTHLLWRQF